MPPQKSLYVLGNDPNIRKDFDEISKNVSLFYYNDPQKLISELKSTDNHIVLIEPSYKYVDNKEFIVTISEIKLFNHSYYLLDWGPCSRYDIELNLSLGYSDILTLPLSKETLNGLLAFANSPILKAG